MLIPAPQEYRQYRAYFEALIALNQDGPRKVSVRALSKRLKWPSAYLSDVLKGRKRLSLPRALQFAHFARFDAFDTDHLVLLVLKDQRDESVQRYVSRRIRKEFDRASKTGPVKSEVFDRLETIELFAVFETLKWLGEVPTRPRLRKLFYSMPKLTPEKFEAMVARLEKEGILKRQGERRIELMQENLYLDQPEKHRIDLHAQWAENFLRHLAAPEFPRSLQAAFLELPVDRFEEIREKVTMFRNWLFELNEQTASDRKHGRLKGNSLVYQLDLNLFPIVRAKWKP